MIGFAITGSFCCFEKAIKILEQLCKDYEVLPVMSYNAYSLDTKFGKAHVHNERIRNICNKDIIRTIPDAEPIGPSVKLDALVICPCTGNTMAKIANGICDTPVTMAAKAHLRNEKPLVIALATNDGLSGNAPSIAKLLQRKNIYFVPFTQDSPFTKTRSLVCDFSLTVNTLKEAISGVQTQPIIAKESNI